jgi:hydrogenase expression/formation protein HypD
VPRQGNLAAQRMMEQVFEICDRKWRGIGAISGSGNRLRAEFAEYDAECVYGAGQIVADEPAGCIAALVLRGLKKPVDCPAFGTRCTPESPLGASMVSSEGVCAAYHAYGCPATEALP